VTAPKIQPGFWADLVQCNTQQQEK